MTKHLIVNADDYGLSKEISDGILEGFQRGIVTATSVVTIGRYFEPSLDALKESGIDTGIHLTFVDEENALTGPIEGLTTENGRFLKSHKNVAPIILSGRYDKIRFEQELYLQTEKMADSGLLISHIDAHQHLHMLPSVFKIVTGIADKFNIPWFRNTSSSSFSVAGVGLNALHLWLKWKTRYGTLKATPYSMGFDTSGFMDETALCTLLKNMKNGITELITHPGYDASKEYDWGYHWEDELSALTSKTVTQILDQQNITLTDYQRLS